MGHHILCIFSWTVIFFGWGVGGVIFTIFLVLCAQGSISCVFVRTLDPGEIFSIHAYVLSNIWDCIFYSSVVCPVPRGVQLLNIFACSELPGSSIYAFFCGRNACILVGAFSVCCFYTFSRALHKQGLVHFLVLPSPGGKSFMHFYVSATHLVVYPIFFLRWLSAFLLLFIST